MMLTNGFYTALGSPIDQNGNCVKESLKKHIHQQIDAGASGLLLMGSMGIEATLKASTYADMIETANQAVDKKLPFFVGAMDNSIARVKERMEMMKGADISGVVVTTPFYSMCSESQLVTYFKTIADASPFPIYLYDLPVVTKMKITYSLIEKLSDHPNIQGIKTADMGMILQIFRNEELNKRFFPLCSNLDMFDYAYKLGICRNLDGMFCCTPKNGRAMYDSLAKGDEIAARKYLDNILLLRDTMIRVDLMPAFTYAMNLLGCNGNFHQDYCTPISEEGKKIMKETMIRIGELV